MKKLLILASFSILFYSCAEAVQKDTPVLISATDSLASLGPLESTPIIADKEKSPGNSQEQQPKDKQVSALTALQGKWIDEGDSLAYLEISSSNWVIGYEGEEVTQDNKYKVTLTDNLPQFVDPKEKGEFIILSNKKDTLYYEINSLTKETLNLTYYPVMNLQVYKRKK